MCTPIFRWVKRLCIGLIFAGCVSLLIGSQPTPVLAKMGCRESIGQIVTVKIDSQVYGTAVPVSIYLPPCYYAWRDALPVIYLLHGANADQTQWPDVQVQPRADELIAQGHSPFVVIMPGGDYDLTLDYSAFVLDDLMPAIEQRFRVQASRSGRAIGGISLGGYWALKIAFSHPDQFAAVGGHSPVVGDADQPGDPYALARTADGLEQLQIALDVGDLDALQPGVTLLAQRLRSRGLPVSLAVNPGNHDRPYWRSQTAAYLQFYLDAFTPVMYHCWVDVFDR